MHATSVYPFFNISTFLFQAFNLMNPGLSSSSSRLRAHYKETS